MLSSRALATRATFAQNVDMSWRTPSSLWMKTRMAGWRAGETRYSCYLWNACVIQWKIYHWQRLDLTDQWRLFCPDNSLVWYVRSTEAHLRMRIEILSIGIYWWFIAIASRIDRDRLYHTHVDTINEQMLHQSTAGEPIRFPAGPRFSRNESGENQGCPVGARSYECWRRVPSRGLYSATRR